MLYDGKQWNTFNRDEIVDDIFDDKHDILEQKIEEWVSIGKDYPIIFDSGIRGGSDIVRALALGADFTMVGRPLMYGIGADGAKGLKRVVDIIKDELSTALGLVGLTDIKDISSDIIAERFIRDFKY